MLPMSLRGHARQHYLHSNREYECKTQEQPPEKGFLSVRRTVQSTQTCS